MERLTTRNSEGVAVLKHPDQCERCSEPIYRLNDLGNGEPISRLAYYEDIQSKLDERFLGCITLEKIIDSFIKFYDQQEKDEQLAECMLIVNDNVKKYEQWKEADAQGLLLRLPCKVGDTIWDNDFGKPCSYEVTGFSFGNLNEDDSEVVEQVIIYYSNWNGSITGRFVVSEIGKTVFLSEPEAETKLKEIRRREEKCD